MSEKNQALKLKRRISRDTRQNIIIVLALLAVMLFFGIKSPYFLKPANLAALLVAAVPLGLIGLAESSCLLIGAFAAGIFELQLLVSHCKSRKKILRRA